MNNKELDELQKKISNLEKEKLKKEKSISSKFDSLKNDQIKSETIEMAVELQKLKFEFKQQKFAKIQKRLKERDSLEKKFKALVEEKTAEIQKHIDAAKLEMEKAQQISDESGVPFHSDVVIGFGDECYIPKSIQNLRDEFDDGEDTIENEDGKYDYGIVYGFVQDNFYLPDGVDYGWASDGWSSSSLTC